MGASLRFGTRPITLVACVVFCFILFPTFPATSHGNCDAQVDGPPYPSSGYVKGRGRHYCGSNHNYTRVQVCIERHDSDGWGTIRCKSSARQGGRTSGWATPQASCQSGKKFRIKSRGYVITGSGYPDPAGEVIHKDGWNFGPWSIVC
jgi:hypothetical protein